MAGKGMAALVIGGAAAFMLMPKKKKRKKAAAKKEGGIADSGSIDRTSPPTADDPNSMAYQWRVRVKEKNGAYVAEIGRPLMRDPNVVQEWEVIGEADNVEDAKDMAISAIEQTPGYEPELEIVDGGQKGDFEWRIYADPERGYVGQYRLPGGQWLAALEGQAYDEGFKLRLWEIAQKAANAAAG